MITPMVAEKEFDKVQNSCMTKTLCKLTVKGTFSTWKRIPTQNLKLTSYLMIEKLETSPLRLGARQGCPSHNCFSI